MSLDMAQLAAFTAVLDEGTFEAAARRLHVTPSAISQRIKALESQLGQIILRRTRPIGVTASGEVLARLARQVTLLESEALTELAAGSGGTAPVRLPIAVNADSLATWFLTAWAALPGDRAVRFDLYQEDQDHTAALLRNGTVMAAVTAESAPAPGCRTVPLGSMRYVAVASREFCTRYFPDGATAPALDRAPVLVFNHKDVLQQRFAEMVARRRVDPPVSFVPSSTAFVEAARLGLAWGMAPAQMAAEPLERGEIVEIAPGRFWEVPLYWQHWRLDSPVLATLTRVVRETAQATLAR